MNALNREPLTGRDIHFTSGQPGLQLDMVTPASSPEPSFPLVRSTATSLVTVTENGVSANERTIRDLLDFSRQGIEDTAQSLKPVAQRGINRATASLRRTGERLRAHGENPALTFDYGDVSDEDLDRADYLAFMHQQINGRIAILHKNRLKAERRDPGRGRFIQSQVIDSQFLNMGYGPYVREHITPRIIAKSKRGTEVYQRAMAVKDAASRNLPSFPTDSLRRQVRVFSRAGRPNTTVVGKLLPALSSAMNALPSSDTLTKRMPAQRPHLKIFDLRHRIGFREKDTQREEPDQAVVIVDFSPATATNHSFAGLSVQPSTFGKDIGIGGDVFTDSWARTAP